MNIAVLGCGNIAEKIAQAVNGLGEDFVPYAAASRDLSKAQKFAEKWGFSMAFGSYEDMLKDDNIDLVYIATPHSHHYQHSLMCLNARKNILVEKAFTANYAQAEEVLSLAKKKNLLCAEAVWTRYMPSRFIISELIDSGIIGNAVSLNASLCYPIEDIPRLRKPELAGGALLDIGVYPINLASMIFGDDYDTISGVCTKLDLGVDAQESISITYKNGCFANLFASIRSAGDRGAVIFGSKGYITVQNINNPEFIRVFDSEHNLLREIVPPPQINGYEYEIIACRDAIAEGKTECDLMPHSQILEIMAQMDKLRVDWGIRYPFE